MSSLPLSAVTAIGTSVARCSRSCAVTTMSPPSSGVLELITGADGAVDCAATGAAAIMATTPVVTISMDFMVIMSPELPPPRHAR